MTSLSHVEQITVTDVSMDLVLTCTVNTWSRRAVIYVWISIHKTMNYFIYMCLLKASIRNVLLILWHTATDKT